MLTTPPPLPNHTYPLQLDFVRQWQAELRVSYQAADAAGFDAGSVAELEALVQSMTEVGGSTPGWRRCQTGCMVYPFCVDASWHTGCAQQAWQLPTATPSLPPQMWWHVGQLRPAYLSYLAHVALPENSGQLALWREIASEVMPYINDTGLALVVRAAPPACPASCP